MTVCLDDPSLLIADSFIDGQWRSATQRFAVCNPATGETVAEVANLGAAETREAIAAAEQAMAGWRARPAKERSVLLRGWFDQILAHQEDLARLMTAEQGKVLAESRLEITYAASFVEWFAEEAKRIYGDIIPGTADRRSIVIKQPVGVVAAITPWNFPSAMITRKVGPALAAGCAVVLKPAAETPLSALALAELADRAGIPRGLFNVVTGTDAVAIGRELTDSAVVRKLTFTGSTPVGKQLLSQSAETVKKVSMELGGNAPILVFADADLDAAVQGAVASKYRNAGQTCVCANRLLVQDSIYDTFLEKFAARVAALQVGDGSDENNTLGPLIDSRARAKVSDMVEDAVSAGARIATGGETLDCLGPNFYQPTVLADVTADMRVFREEIFGPVAPVLRFHDEAEAIAMANDTEYGLAAYLYTSDIGRVWRVSEAIEYGMVGVNEVAITSELIPFGGVKESGLGREGSHYGIDDYLDIKYICMGGIAQA
ncbi:NAD-dependent succinate-semialdehyde dehydrogenase [Seongchinamella unica]|uniref:NAD-dependent succinate-semialdehyde dehydrogenase n=1 Tax=Seongchinamella unica TaxID=2547392 RepID=A0A4R5LRR4_9GAMM|nr:NAD-dependent succinate-semialdehyde dehydrogenase [Seongchinamella unica]TDG13578.1 NAD-dependent succinate-semialdehyde dehydrogenase [Seongchinamella unica]